MSEATPFVGFASHRSIVLDPTFDSTFESNDLLYGIIGNTLHLFMNLVASNRATRCFVKGFVFGNVYVTE